MTRRLLFFPATPSSYPHLPPPPLTCPPFSPVLSQLLALFIFLQLPEAYLVKKDEGKPPGFQGVCGQKKVRGRG